MRAAPAFVVLQSVLFATPAQDVAEPFVPFEGRAYRLVNSVAFSADDQTMYFTLFYREVLAHRGRPDTTAAEVALFRSQRRVNGWSEPQLAPFSGTWSDYEPALAHDGSVLLFNSKRPYPDGRIPPRNDLWMVERQGEGWGQPKPLDGLNSFDLEESYATIDRERRIVFVKGPVREGGDDFDLYETRIGPDGMVEPPRRLPFSDDRFGEGDPQLAPDGSFLIFTRWDHQVGWQQTCDLYIAFRSDAGWTEPVPLSALNTPRPDYAAALSSDGRWLYYRAGGSLLRRPLERVLGAVRP